MGKVNRASIANSLRRIVTGNTAEGKSTVVLDDGPQLQLGDNFPSGMHEIWTEILTQKLDSTDFSDQGKSSPAFSPDSDSVKVRWFEVRPIRSDSDFEKDKAITRTFFQDFGAEHQLHDQEGEPLMHQTESLDIVCLLSGKASLVLNDDETRLSPGQVVIQRGTEHTWRAHDKTALFLAVQIGRKIATN